MLDPLSGRGRRPPQIEVTGPADIRRNGVAEPRHHRRPPLPGVWRSNRTYGAADADPRLVPGVRPRSILEPVPQESPEELLVLPLVRFHALHEKRHDPADLLPDLPRRLRLGFLFRLDEPLDVGPGDAACERSIDARVEVAREGGHALGVAEAVRGDLAEDRSGELVARLLGQVRAPGDRGLLHADTLPQPARHGATDRALRRRLGCPEPQPLIPSETRAAASRSGRGEGVLPGGSWTRKCASRRAVARTRGSVESRSSPAIRREPVTY